MDVGSGGGAPGIPLAHALPDREVVLLEAERRKCEFLERFAPPNARVVWGRAEEQETDWAGVAVAKALAQPPTAAEWCLPLVREGGAACSGSARRPTRATSLVWRIVLQPSSRRARPGFSCCARSRPTPAGFPRRVGVARKRPLA